MPRDGVYDNEAALVSRHGGKATLTPPFQRFRGTLGMGVIVCKPGDPEAKGLVERANQYLETSFMPGRRFSSTARLQRATARAGCARPTIGCTRRCAADRPTVSSRTAAAMMALPPVLPDPAWRETKRLGRDHWVRIGTCDYSVHPRAIGRRVEVRMDLDEVVVTCAGDEVARHPRSWARHRTITDPDHERARIVMRAFAAAVERRSTTTSRSATCPCMTERLGSA